MRKISKWRRPVAFGKVGPRYQPALAGLQELLGPAAIHRGGDVHLVMDNYATHKAPLIRNWLAIGDKYRIAAVSWPTMLTVMVVG